MNKTIMTMPDPPALLLAALAGLALGAVFFGGLWWTIRAGLTSSRPAACFIFSLVIRLGLTLTGFYFVGGGDWRRLLACAAGFLLARFLVVRLTRLAATAPPSQPED